MGKNALVTANNFYKDEIVEKWYQVLRNEDNEKKEEKEI